MLKWLKRFARKMKEELSVESGRLVKPVSLERMDDFQEMLRNIIESDYEMARKKGFTCTDGDRELIPSHHYNSIRLMEFLKQHDFSDYDDYFGWKTGGDGDNGEVLMSQLDAFFSLVDWKLQNMDKIIMDKVTDICNRRFSIHSDLREIWVVVYQKGTKELSKWEVAFLGEKFWEAGAVFEKLKKEGREPLLGKVA